MPISPSRFAWICLFCLGALSAGRASFAQEPRSAARAEIHASRRVVIPFDFESKFDGGRYGQKIGELVWSKLRREDTFILPESMQDVRESCQRSGVAPGIDTPLETMARIAHKEQGGDIAIWGKVERASGFETDVYDLWIRIADVSANPPQMLYSKQVRTQTVSEIPHRHIRDALAGLIGPEVKRPAAPHLPQPSPLTIGPRLLSCNFERGTSAPEGWSPLGANVSWSRAESNPKQGRFLRFSLADDVAGTTGVLSYSKPFPVEAGATYRLQCRWRSSGPALKVFVKCYAEVAGLDDSSTGVAVTQPREVYRSQQNLHGPIGTWNFHTEQFTPRHAKFTPRWGRIMLYAYWPAGTADWDDVEVTQVDAPSKRSVRSHGSE